MVSFDPEILKANDIRGTYPQQLDDAFAYLLGRVLPGVTSARKVAVGHDARVSSPALYAALVAGLGDGGAQVETLGMGPTELLYFVLGRSHEYDLGVMITASHNPPEFNGFKVCGPDAEPVSRRTGLQKAADAIRALDAPDPLSPPKPETSLHAQRDYLHHALETAGRPECPDLRVGVDPGNGVGGLLWEHIARETGIEPIRMNFEPDGTFPAHLPDISQIDNMTPLRDTVLQAGADLGLAYDGDADRVRAVLADGHVMDGSEIGAALGLRILHEHPDRRMAISLTAGRGVLDFLERQGCEPLIVPVGHAKVKDVMRSDPSVIFAAESSGHFYYRDFHFSDSALISTLLLLQMAAADELRPVAQAATGTWHPPADQPTFRFERWEDARQACRQAAEKAVQRFPDYREIMCEHQWRISRHCTPADVRRADGVRVDHPTWWFAVRPSGTEPVARLTVEARSRREATEKATALEALFEGNE